MKNAELGKRIKQEIVDFIETRKSLQLSSLTAEQKPYASYAPFAIGDECIYVLLSEIAKHAVNLQENTTASVLIIEDEETAKELFARKRVNYSVNAELIALDDARWQEGIECLAARHGDRINTLSGLTDFKLFKLVPTEGRYVKGFGRAYGFTGESLSGDLIEHMTDGHKKRSAA